MLYDRVSNYVKFQYYFSNLIENLDSQHVRKEVLM